MLGFNGYVVSDWGASNDHVAGVEAGSHIKTAGTFDESSQGGCAMLGVSFCSEKGQAILAKIH